MRVIGSSEKSCFITIHTLDFEQSCITRIRSIGFAGKPCSDVYLYVRVEVFALAMIPKSWDIVIIRVSCMFFLLCNGNASPTLISESAFINQKNNNNNNST